MALEKFKAAPLPQPPTQYDPQYLRQLIRVLELYFSQLDSLTPNQAQSYRAQHFYGGDFTGTTLTANDVSTTTLEAVDAVFSNVDTDRVDAIYMDTDALHAHNAIIETIMGDQFYGGTFYGDGRFLQLPYNQFTSSANQTAASTAAAYAVTYNTTSFLDGITIVSNSQITFAKKGIYKLDYSLSFKNTVNDSVDIDVWYRYNGVDIPNSNSRFSIPARKSTGNPSYLIAVTPFMVDIQADGAYVELIWRVGNTGVSLEAIPAVTASPGVTPAIPATPSVILTAQHVSAQFPPKTRVAPLPVIGFGQIGNVSVNTL